MPRVANKDDICVNCKEPILHPFMEGGRTDNDGFICGNCCSKLLQNKTGIDKLDNLLREEEQNG